MRLIDVVLGGVLLGLTLGFLHTGLPGARASGELKWPPATAPSPCASASPGCAPR